MIFQAGDDGELEPGTAMRYKKLPEPLRLGCLFKGLISTSGFSADDPYLFSARYCYLSMLSHFTILICYCSSGPYYWQYDLADSAIEFDALMQPVVPVSAPVDLNSDLQFLGATFKYQQIGGKSQAPLNTHVLIPKGTVVCR